MKNVLSSTSPNTQDRLCHEILKSKMKNGEKVQFYTGGKPATLYVTDVKRELFPAAQISATTMNEVKTLSSLSDRQTVKVAQTIEKASPSGVRLIEPNLRKKLSERGKVLEDHFSMKICKFIEKKDDNPNNLVREKPVVFCRNIAQFVDVIAEKRGLKKGEYNCKIGLDSGGGFLKVHLHSKIDCFPCFLHFQAPHFSFPSGLLFFLLYHLSSCL